MLGRRPLLDLLCIPLLYGLVAGPAAAHPGPGANPPLLRNVSLDKLEIKAQYYGTRSLYYYGADVPFGGKLPADGVDQNAEFLIFTTLRHAGHGYAFVDTYNSGMTRTVWRPNVEIYEHRECSPANPIEVHGTVVEMDQDLTTNVVSNLGAAAAGFYVANLPGAVVGFLISVVAGMNGDDSFGAFGGEIPAKGSVTLKFASTEGDGEVTFTGFTDGLVVDIGCGDDEGTAEPPPTPGEKTAMIMEPLYGALEEAALLTAEAGNPGGTSERMQLAIRETATSMAMGLAETAAGLAVDRVRDLAGAGFAVETFLGARSAAIEGDDLAALDGYSKALQLALRAEEAPEEAESAALLPLSTHVAPSFYATRPGTAFQLTTTVLGALEPPELFVVDAPEGMTIEVLPDPETPALFGLEVQLDDDIAQGSYSVGILAVDGDRTTQAEAEIVVGPPSASTFLEDSDDGGDGSDDGGDGSEPGPSGGSCLSNGARIGSWAGFYLVFPASVIPLRRRGRARRDEV